MPWQLESSAIDKGLRDRQRRPRLRLKEWGEKNFKKVLQIATKGYVLQKGEIVVRGSQEDLYENDVIKKAYLRG